MAAGGPQVLLQPIVDLQTGYRIGAEALSRFPAEWGGAGRLLRGGAQRRSRARSRAARPGAGGRPPPPVAGYVAMNVSPATLVTTRCTAPVGRLPLDRVILELSEHDRVQDYDALDDALAPLRARGMRLAIDDVGAGFSSLRHIVADRADVIKLDRTIVPVSTPTRSSPTWSARWSSSRTAARRRVVAEGVESAGGRAVLAALGVDHGQGWHFGRPGRPEDLPAYLPPMSAVTATTAALTPLGQV